MAVNQSRRRALLLASQIDGASANHGATMMFCGEYEGRLETSHLSFRADEVRRSVGSLYFGYGANISQDAGWAEARKRGWRVVKVKIVRANEYPAHGEVAGVLAQLRHAYRNLIDGAVKNQKEFANGLIAPQIRRLERLQQ